MKKTNFSKEEATSGTPSYMIINDIWALEKIGAKNFDTEKSNHRPVIEIHVKEMKLYGNDSCNEIFAKVTALDDTVLTIEKIGGTKKGCPDMATPKQFRTALLQTANYKIANLKLHLFDIKGKELLRFRKVD